MHHLCSSFAVLLCFAMWAAKQSFRHHHFPHGPSGSILFRMLCKKCVHQKLAANVQALAGQLGRSEGVSGPAECFAPKASELITVLSEMTVWKISLVVGGKIS